jgi:ClpP class serine protease
MHPQISEYLSRPLAISPSALPAIERMAPRAETVGAVYSAGGGVGGGGYTMVGTVAHVPVSGPISFGGGFFAWLFGMCDTEGLAQSLYEAAGDGMVGTVLLDIHSPGGDTFGMSDLLAACDAVKAAGKRLVAIVHDSAFSGAYWLACRCDEIYLTESAMLGDIGAYLMLEDSSEQFRAEGRRRILVASTPLKGAGMPGLEVSEVQIASLGSPIERIHEAFVADVAAGRGVSVETVEAWAASPHAYGQVAVERGMADGVVTFRGLLEELASLTPSGVITMANDTKSAAAVKHAAKAVAEPKGEAVTTEDGDAMKAENDSLKTAKAALEAEVAGLKAQLEEMTPTDTGEEDEEPKASAFSEFTAAFKAAGIEVDDGAKVAIFDAIDDGLTPRAAVRMHQRVSTATQTSDRIREARARAEGESTQPVAKGPGAVPESYELGVKALIASGEATKENAYVMAAKRWPDLHKAYIGG